MTYPLYAVVEAPSVLGLFPGGVETSPEALLRAGYDPRRDTATMSHSEVLFRLSGRGEKHMIRWTRIVPQIPHLLAAAALVAGLGLGTTTAAQESHQTSVVSAYTLTPKRIAASTAAVVALIGAVIGALALARSTRRIGSGNGQRGAIVALVLGPIGLIIGSLVVATADGGLGTGNGLGGGVVAMMVGLIGMALGGLALARSRRTA